MKKKICILGAGISGNAVANYYLSLGYEVIAVDKKESADFPCPVLNESQIAHFDPYDQVIVSPGWRLDHPLVGMAGKKAVGEIELGFQNKKNPMIGITGTNGKTTVTALVTYVLNQAGQAAYAVGNFGEPLLTAPDEGILVVELSSFQLQWAKTAKLKAAALLNITPDHLDWHRSMQEYAEAKANICTLIEPNGSIFLFEECHKEWPDLFAREGITLYGSALKEHDRQNEEAARLLVEPFGIDKKEFDRLKEGFKKPKHRIEFVREVKGVAFYDDSKGTNIDATIKAVLALKKPIRLIAGGVDKGFPYSSWKEPFRGRVRSLHVIGQAASKMALELGEEFVVHPASTLEEAVSVAFSDALPGEVVLLSPGCSSFDMFKNYADRGEKFQKIVHQIKG